LRGGDTRAEYRDFVGVRETTRRVTTTRGAPLSSVKLATREGSRDAPTRSSRRASLVWSAALRILFPAVFDGSANEPKIKKTDVNVHDEAWFYLKKGATSNGVTNKSVFDWSSSPVANKKVYLVSDAWYPLGSGWSNAAYISSICVLKDHSASRRRPASCSQSSVRPDQQRGDQAASVWQHIVHVSTTRALAARGCTTRIPRPE
jgi:hypothetical protein